MAAAGTVQGKEIEPLHHSFTCPSCDDAFQAELGERRNGGATISYRVGEFDFALTAGE